MTRHDIIQMHLKRVLDWNLESILELTELLYDLYHSIRHQWDSGMDCWRETEEGLEDYLDPAQLPTDAWTESHLPDENIWAMDRQGNCLISLDFDATNYGYNLNRLIRMGKTPASSNRTRVH